MFGGGGVEDETAELIVVHFDIVKVDVAVVSAWLPR